ncbi:MAG TPA: amino acid adenylation domain-containing protein [Methylomirabilota bacterium]|nr:amino acid adenylation domain-containing protein [Methylomirabilota bacterium]
MRVLDRERLDAYLAQHAATAPAAIARRPPGAAAPLSFAQQQIWLHAQLAPEVPLYNEPFTIRRTGPLDVRALEAALSEIVRRHEAWRTTFAVEGGAPVQIVQPPWPVRLPLVDLTSLPVEARQPAALRLAHDDARRAFDLGRCPLVRALLVRLADDDHRLFLTVHHIVLDGVSIYRVLLPELTALYEAFAAGCPSPLAEPPVQYADFAVWQRERLRGDALAASLAWWRRHLEHPPALLLPVDRPRPAVQSFAGARHCLALSPRLSRDLKTLARRENSSLYMTLLAAFEVLLHRYTGQDDLMLGTVSAGRSRPELENLLGFFANPVPLRADLGGDPTFAELLGCVRERTLEALAHDDVPFELLVNELSAERDAGRNPLFQVAFSLEAPRAPAAGGWDASHLDVDVGTSKFDLYLELDERPDTIVGRVVYRTDLFDAATIARLAGAYERLLEAVVADPCRRLSALPVLDESERGQLLVAWSTTRAPYPEDSTVHAVFEAQAAGGADAVALIMGDERVTYAELNRRANRLAHRLRALGVRPDDRVGVCLERSIDLVIALLGILKAGGAYVPLDPAYPRDRLRFMVADAGVRVLLTRAGLRDRVAGADLRVVALDAEANAVAAERDDNPPGVAWPDSLAYVMYTSGSTGQPKGVAVPHRAILRLLFGQTYARLDASRTLLHLAPISFDASTFELWGALLHGARCVLFPAALPTHRALADVVRRHGVTTLWLTASLFNTVIDEAPETLAGVEEILTGGEALSPAHVRRAYASLPNATIVNGYGPTESTTFACCYRIPNAPEPGAASIPIGRPIANTEVYVLDAHRQPVPIGVAGELYIGGAGLAHGYVERPELTDERFVPHPFDATAGARLYRTGDLVRWRADGLLEFLGRLDGQVKIRGFRVEPGEIETALATHPRVREAAVIARERTAGDRTLIAYVVPRPGGGVTPEALRDYLKARLPAFMVPAAFVEVAVLPLTPIGKVDRAALAAVEAPSAGTRQLAPRDPLEARLVALWEETLGVGPIGVKDDFFALGGHSLAAVRIVQQIERLLGQALPLTALYANPTVEDVARVLLRRERERFLVPVLKLQDGSARRPFFFFHGDLNGGGFYCRDLARHLGPQQPVYAVHPLGLDGGRVPATIEAMADVHVELIRGLQPHGPYLIGGYCNGGLVAYEVARRLATGGEPVEPVVLIAAAADTRLRALRPVADHVAALLGLGAEEAADYFGRLRYLVDRFAAVRPRRRVALALETLATMTREIAARLRGVTPSLFDRTPIPADAGTAVRVADELLSQETYARYFTAVMAYVPRRFPGRLLVFWPDGEVPRRPGDPLLGWQPLAEHVRVIRVPGDHHTVVTRHAEFIARTMQDELPAAADAVASAA